MKACALGDLIAFRILPIKGWLRDYRPRPDELYVRVLDNRRYEDAVVWATGISYEDFDKRVPRTVISYGERISGWGVTQPPKPLMPGIKYSVSISDGGHGGSAEFEVGQPLLAC